MFAEIEYYIIPALACVCLLVFIMAGRTTPMGKVSNYFMAGTFVILLVIMSEVVEHLYASPACTYPTWQRWSSSIIAYLLRPGVAFILMLIPLRNRPGIYKFVLAIPLLINAFFLLISPFCGIVFTYSASNLYSSGPLKFLPFVVGAIYLLLYLVFSCEKARKLKERENTVAIPIVLMCCLAVFLESEYDLVGLLPTAAVIGMIFYYMYFYMDFFTTDALTGAYQRTKFYNDVNHNEPRYFILFDVNGLKQINDNNGHIAGDAALESFGQTVLALLPKNAKFYRIGGDEFGILYYKANKGEICSLIDKIKDSIDRNALPYGVSVGYSFFDMKEDFNAAYKSADEMMYKSKDNFWDGYRAKGKNGGVENA